MSTSTQSADVPAPRRQLSPGRKRLFALVVLAVILVVQEIACRWLFPLPEVDDFNRINYTPLAAYGESISSRQHEGLSNIKFRWESEPDGYAFDHTLNLYGFRGPDFAIDKPEGRPRVVFVGDSFTEGAGAAGDDSLPEQFRRLVAADKPADVINLGVCGIGFPEYVRLARDAVALLKPDVLFLVCCFNDLPTKPEPPPTPSPEFPRHSLMVPRALAALARKREGRTLPSRFYTGPFPYLEPVPSLANILTRKFTPKGVDPAILSAMERGKCNSSLLIQAGAHEKLIRYDFSKGGGAELQLTYIAGLCKQANAKLVVMFIPIAMTANPIYMKEQWRLGAPPYKVDRLDGPEYRSAQRHLREVTAKLGVPFLDATDELIAVENSGSRLFWPIDNHCNAAGYHVLAEICARHFKDGSLPRGPAGEGE
jgi:lysophospholipase L1-like esterase